ncbi:MAG TPA: NAD-dependent epimerase/dehydratase family protein [bacterium]|nr:NAD-dependent epimerase/dehydratase family protein [bacterium]
MRILVTGGAGFIGSHLCETLLDEGHQIVCVDDFNDYYDPRLKRENIQNILKNPNYSLYESDILNYEAMESIFADYGFDIVVHLAARAGVRPSIQQPRLYQKVNVEGTVNLLDLCVRHRVPGMVMASSSSVYGNNRKVPFSENDPVDHPISPYAATKKACELIGYTYHALYGLSVTCLRFFTVYGPRQRPDMAIHKFTRLIDEGKPVPFYGDGTSRRDYTYITDIIQGIRQSIARCEGYHIFNLGESRTISLEDLISLIESNLGKKAVLKKMSGQPGDVNITYADISLAKRVLDYRPSVSIEEGISLYTEWYRTMKSGKAR